MLARLVYDESNVSIWQALGPRILVGVSILGGIAILGFVGIRVARSFLRKKAEDRIFLESAQLKLNEPEPEHKQDFDVDRLFDLVGDIGAPDLQEFLTDICESIQGAAHLLDETAPAGFVEEIVDRLDDLRTLAKNQSADASLINEFASFLEHLLSRCDALLLHSDSWNPTIQRAISKEPIPDITEPRILHFGSSGIQRAGQLIRKQEVVLAIPQPN